MSEIRNNEEILHLINGLGDNSIATNVQTTYIVTTEDKIRILYDEYNDVRKKADTMYGWFGILVALLIADLTCDFKDVIFINKYIVAAMFYLSTILCCAFFFYSLYQWHKNKKKLEFEFFINKLKGDNLFITEKEY